MVKASLRSPSYLSKNDFGWCFRIRIPSDLDSVIGKKTLRFSLKTGRLGQAKVRARYLAGNIQMLFRALRRRNPQLKKLTPELVNELIRQYRDRAIEDAERSVNRNHEDRTSWDYEMRNVKTDDDLYGFMHGQSSLAEWYKLKALTGDYEGADEAAEKLCNKNDIAYSTDSDEFRSLCQKMLFADSEAASIVLDLLEKGYPDRPHKVCSLKVCILQISPPEICSHEVRTI